MIALVKTHMARRVPRGFKAFKRVIPNFKDIAFLQNVECYMLLQAKPVKGMVLYRRLEFGAGKTV